MMHDLVLITLIWLFKNLSCHSRHPMDEHPIPGSKSTQINGASKFWFRDIGTPWLYNNGNDKESRRVKIFTCYIDSKQWINHLKATKCRDIYSSKIVVYLTGSRPKVLGRVSSHSNWVKLKGGNQGELLLFNDEKY